MSISFYSNPSSSPAISYHSPCLCAQMADSFCPAMDGDFSDAVLGDLKAHADPTCGWCKGTGVEMVEKVDAPSLNLANDNAGLLFAALGVPFDPCGDMTIPEARRAIMRARSRSNLKPFTRETEVAYGRPQASEDGVVVLRPLRSYGMGVDEERMASYIERFASFVETSVTRGADTITWC